MNISAPNFDHLFLT